jgi:Flp pilus assembly protein TadD
VSRFEQLAALLPGSASARSNLGYALVGVGRAMDAVLHLERSVQLDPTNAVAFNNLGIAYERSGARPQAIHAFERALSLDPKFADAAVNLGNVHNRLGATTASRAAFARALAVHPMNLAAKTGLAFAQALDGDPEGARAVLEAYARSAPPSPWFQQTLAAVRHWCGDLAAAEDAYRRAAAIDPGDPDARFGIASTMLGRGDYAAGWRAFEERADGCFGPARQFPDLPAWDGMPMAGLLVVHAEQGLGDVVQFARFIPQAAGRVGKVVVVADGSWRTLGPLLATLSPAIDVVTDAAAARAHPERPVARCSVLSLPWLLGIGPQDLPGSIPYLAVPDAYAQRWHPRIAALPRPRVGLAWAAFARGDHGYVTRHKSVPLALLAPLIDTPGVAFVSLQLGAAGALAPLGARARRVFDPTADINDFGDTAAIIGELDLVISTDTSVAHVAAALGTPVWLLDRYNSCWRWRLAARRSPWYPSLRIFRQRRFLDWSHPLTEVQAALTQWLAGGGSGDS